MDRKEFTKMLGLLGVGFPVLNACSPFAQSNPNLPESVIIVGAGAAGLTAAHLLIQKGVQVQVLEANPVHGGRMKRTTDFADFPIPVGAEWLHTQRAIFDKIVNNQAAKVDIPTKPYDFDQDEALVEGKKVNLKKVGFTIDQKFIGSTWFDFFDQYVMPGIQEKILYDQVVKSIDYSSDQVNVKTGSAQYVADKVIITVPVKILQDGLIQFTPALPKKKQEAIERVIVWGGCKAFFKFKEKFYPTVTWFGDASEEVGHKLFYDAAYGQESQQPILGLFAVGPASGPYLGLSPAALTQYILAELDQLFDGQASRNYVDHIFQNWSEERFAKGAYVQYFESWRAIKALGKPVKDLLFFAGDAYTDGSEWSSVHAAAQSAIEVVKKLAG